MTLRVNARLSQDDVAYDFRRLSDDCRLFSACHPHCTNDCTGTRHQALLGHERIVCVCRDKSGTPRDEIQRKRKFHVIYQREWVFDILDHNGIDYDQVAVVDSDTIINPKCPNFFEKTNYEYTVVVQNADYEWVGRSIDGWHHHLLPNEIKPKVWEYHNAGFVIVNKKHKEFLDIVKDFYTKNIEKINDIRYYKSYAGIDVLSTGQTIMNFLVIKHNIKRTFLPERYNFGGLYMKNLLWAPWLNIHASSWWSDELIFLDMGWIYHFAGIPKLNTEEAVEEHIRRFGQKSRDTSYWMKRTYEELYETG